MPRKLIPDERLAQAAAHDGDMDNAREAAIREGIHPDGIALDDFDELLND